MNAGFGLPPRKGQGPRMQAPTVDRSTRCDVSVAVLRLGNGLR
jgi:hypothetical protein